MIARQIKDVRNFMSKLLMEDCFDSFLVNEISITTYNTFTIDGHLQKEFYPSEELDTLKDDHLSYWSKLKPFCLSVIKGRHTPLRFRLIFALDRHHIAALLNECETSLNMNDINELFLNIRFENGCLTCITGCSLKLFTPDKSIEKAFDRYIEDFIDRLSRHSDV